MNYQVKVVEVTIAANPAAPNGQDTSTKELDRFSVEAVDEDGAKLAARQWFSAHGRTLRALSWAPGEGGQPELLAYVKAV